MKIAFDVSVLADEERTGIGVHTYELVKAMIKRNVSDQFILFAISPFVKSNSLENLDLKDFPNIKMRVFRYPLKMFRTSFLLWQKLNFPNIEHFIGSVDIFHSFNWYMPPQRFGKKVATVFDLTSILHPEWHDPRTTQLDLSRFKKIQKDADLVVTFSKSVKDDFLSYYPGPRVEAVYPGKGELSNILLTKEEISKVLKKYNLRSDFFLAVSTIEPRKNFLTLMKAYLKSNLENDLVIVGKKGWNNDEILSLADKHRSKIKLLGFVSDLELKVLYTKTLSLVYPSLYEGFGIPVLDAMSMGGVVITSNVSSLPEVGGKGVYYVNPYNQDEITDALIKVSKDDKLRSFLKKQALLQADKFSWSKSADKLTYLYKSLLK